MLSVFQRLEIVVRSHSSGRLGAPQRIALPSDLFAQFQTDFRKLAAEVGIEAIYPGSVLGVPVVESAGHSATVTAADGTETFLQLNGEGSELPCALLRPVTARP